VAKKSDVVVGVIIGASFLFFLFFLLLGILSLSGGKTTLLGGFGKKVAIIDVVGAITNSDDVIRQLKRYTQDSSVPSIVLNIDSPGGGIAPSQEIYEEIKKAKEKGKKIVASMSSMAASGGYYIACAADTIVANPGSITGSIGVIFEFPVAEKLFKKIGLEFEVVKSGDAKDMGTYVRPMTEKERRLLQSVINDVYDQFVNVLVEQRKIPREEVLEFADGRIFTGNQAKQLGLVDVIGNLEDAVQIAGKMGGIEGSPATVKERKRKITLMELLSQKFNGLLNLNQRNSGPEFMYIFR
jgi:protease IV